MKQNSSSPSLLRDVVAVAGLYRQVIWMLGQQLRHGPDWQERIQEEALRIHGPGESRETVAQRRN